MKKINSKKIFKNIVALAIILNISIPSFFNIVNAAIYPSSPLWPGTSELRYDAVDNSVAFPETYKPYIRNLKASHPNWIFKAVYTNLDWAESVRHESYEVKTVISLVPNSYSEAWKTNIPNTTPERGWAIASKKAVAYAMDPRNYLNDTNIFQFEALDYNAETSKIETIEKIMTGTTMSSYPTQYKKNGGMITFDNNLTWAQIIKDAAKNAGGSGINAIFLASRMKQETSLEILNNGSISGSSLVYPGVYNFFNINSTPNADGTGAVENGLKHAYEKSWTTPILSINAGATFLWSSYIQWGQNTVYFQKFDVGNVYGNAKSLYGHQYMTNILAPAKESQMAYNAYNNSGLLNSSFVFYIPVFNNMPNEISASPDSESPSEMTGTDIIYLDDIKDKNVPDVFQIRSSPVKENNVIKIITETREGAENRTKFVRTQVGTNGWDKIRLEDGTEGYIYQEFVKKYDYTHVTGLTFENPTVSLKVGGTTTIVPIITPTNAYLKNITWSSGTPSVATVNKNGIVNAVNAGTTNITGITLDGKITSVCTVTVTYTNIDVDAINNIITKIDLGTTTDAIKNKMKSIDESYESLTKKVFNIDGREITGEEKVGTGTKIQILNPDESILKEYTIVIYGDVNGDGKVSASDYVLIKNYIMSDVKSLNPVQSIGADYNKDGKVSASDYVLIKNYIMQN